MKTLLVFIGGIITGVLLILGAGYAFIEYHENLAGEYEPDWTPDFEERHFESVAELAAAKTEYERWIAIGDVGLWSVDAGAIDKAEDFANETLKIASKYSNDWNYGNAIHKAHLTLGRVALRRNDLEEAVRQLILAGETPGSPQLDTFGPNMVLALELLEKGETSGVVRYLELCAEFWESPFDKTRKWRAQVLAGEMPNFGSNLLY